MLGVCLSRSCFSIKLMYVGTFVYSELGYGTTGYYGKCGFGMMYVEWYGIYIDVYKVTPTMVANQEGVGHHLISNAIMNQSDSSVKMH